MNQGQPNTVNLQQKITECITLFQIHREFCLQKIIPLHAANPNNLKIIEILGACHSLNNKHIEGRRFYEACLERDPLNLAFNNNLAYNCIQAGEYVLAVTILNDIKQKWHHPTIYHNLAIGYERGRVNDHNLIDEAILRAEQYRKFYPDYEEHFNSGLINTFLLTEKAKYTVQIDNFKREIFELVFALQNLLNSPFNFVIINQLLQQMSRRITYRRQQQIQHGIVIDKKQKACMEVIQAFRTIILPIYVLEYEHELGPFITYAIQILNDGVFTINIEDTMNYNTIQTEVIQPCVVQLNNLNLRITQFLVNLNTDRQISDKQKQRVDRYKRPNIDKDQIDFRARLRDLEDEQSQQQDILQKLRVQADSQTNPLFVYIKFKKLHYDIKMGNINWNRMRQELVTVPDYLRQKINQITNPQNKEYLLKYYHALNLLLHFYNFYGSNNFLYQQNKVPSNISLNHYISVISPIINELVQTIPHLGWICNQIHFSIVKYLLQTSSQQNYQMTVNNMLRNINQIINGDRLSVSLLLFDIISSKKQDYLNSLLSDDFIEIDQSTAPHRYFVWKMNRHHKLNRDHHYSQPFTTLDQKIISNITVQLVTIAELKFNSNNNRALEEAFTECYYESRQTQPYRKLILRKFYQSNHQIPRKQLMLFKLRKFIKKILF